MCSCSFSSTSVVFSRSEHGRTPDGQLTKMNVITGKRSRFEVRRNKTANQSWTFANLNRTGLGWGALFQVSFRPLWIGSRTCRTLCTWFYSPPSCSRRTVFALLHLSRLSQTSYSHEHRKRTSHTSKYTSANLHRSSTFPSKTIQQSSETHTPLTLRLNVSNNSLKVRSTLTNMPPFLLSKNGNIPVISKF